jgi:TPR repeat protein
MQELKGSLAPKCPFCRHPIPGTKAESDKNVMKRIETDDSVAMSEMGVHHYHEGDYSGALKYLTKAAELGHIGAHHLLSELYDKGQGVEKDVKKRLYHLEETAIGGHPNARYNLGCHEGNNGRIERAMKHIIISANLGDDVSIGALKREYTRGRISKEDLTAAVRAHQAAVDATKSPQREEAEAFLHLQNQG